MTSQERYERNIRNEEPAVWHHVWATEVLRRTHTDLIDKGQHGIAHLIGNHLERAQADRDRAINEAAALERQINNDPTP